MTYRRGESGNPAGRPPGRGRVAQLRRAIEAQAEGIVTALIANAQAGDTAAAKVLLDRCLPALRPVDAPVSLPLGDDLAGAPAAVLKALAAGTLTPDQAGTIAASLAALARVREFTELVERIERLETRTNDRTNP